MRRAAKTLFLCLGLCGSSAFASTVTSTAIQVSGDDLSFIFGLGTASSHTPGSASLTYGSPGPSGTSHIVIWANGAAYDLGDTTARTVVSPMTAVGSGTGAYVQATYDLIAVPLRVTVHYEIADDPQTGAAADTMKVKLTLENIGGAPITYGVRLMFDTMINGNDGANISVNNGISTVTTNSIYTQSGTGIPGNWWGYDVAPPGTPNLVGRGSLWGNPNGEAATMPDAFEVAGWGYTTGLARWSTAGAGAITDSSVVLWWTGTGSASSPTLSLAPGASRSIVTYYGINDGTLLATFTPVGSPTPSPTITPTRSNSPSFTVSPTLTQTWTITQTFSPSPTLTASATRSASPSASPTRSATPSATATPTASVTASSTSSATLTSSRTVTPTYTASATPTSTKTITATFSISPTYSPSPTITPTFSISPTFSITKTPVDQSGEVQIRGVYPNPFSEQVHAILVLKDDATVDIGVYNVAGEPVYNEKIPKLAGVNIWDWNGINNAGARLASGVYVIRASCPDWGGQASYLVVAIAR